MKCKIKCFLITDKPRSSFIPSEKFKDMPHKKLWVEVNKKRKPPVEVVHLDWHTPYLGIDGAYIHLTIDTHSCYLVERDILSIDGYDMFINELRRIN